MRKEENYIQTEIEPADLTKLMLEKSKEGYRFVQAQAVSVKGGYELTYSLALGYQLENYRLNISEDTEIVSVSEIYPSAMLFENEMKELFGVKIDCISLDYDNRFYRIEEETPFKNKED